ARLRMADHARDAAARLEADLRQLRGLAAARVAADDDHAMGRERREDLRARAARRRRSQRARARQLDSNLGAAELGVADGQRAAVELDRLTHDREADALPRHRFVGSLAALTELLRELGPDSAAVVADADREALGVRVARDANLRLAVLVRVVHQ